MRHNNKIQELSTLDFDKHTNRIMNHQQPYNKHEYTVYIHLTRKTITDWHARETPANCNAENKSQTRYTTKHTINRHDNDVVFSKHCTATREAISTNSYYTLHRVISHSPLRRHAIPTCNTNFQNAFYNEIRMRIIPSPKLLINATHLFIKFY